MAHAAIFANNSHNNSHKRGRDLGGPWDAPRRSRVVTPIESSGRVEHGFARLSTDLHGSSPERASLFTVEQPGGPGWAMESLAHGSARGPLGFRLKMKSLRHPWQSMAKRGL
jgi:hypothetical protein